jgi:outer membrane protein assembly factor BamB
LFGVRLSGRGDVTKTNHVWKREDIGAFVPTPVVHGNQVIVLGDRGDVECLDPQTGQTIWREQYPQARANFYASPLLLGPYLYTIREDGAAFVSEIENGAMKLLAENEMQQDIVGSPIPLGNSILIRGETHLFCISPE